MTSQPSKGRAWYQWRWRGVDFTGSTGWLPELQVHISQWFPGCAGRDTLIIRRNIVDIVCVKAPWTFSVQGVAGSGAGRQGAWGAGKHGVGLEGCDIAGGGDVSGSSFELCKGGKEITCIISKYVQYPLMFWRLQNKWRDCWQDGCKLDCCHLKWLDVL